MTYPIKEHESWKILDSSKIQDFMSCPRQYFYRYMLGWKSESPNNHLIFGEAVHLAMEHLLINGYNDTSASEAFDLFNNRYREDFPENTDELFAPKTPTRVLKMLAEYVEKYKTDLKDFDVLYTEVAGTVPLAEDRTLAFRQDSICRGHEGIFSLEHKTRKGSIDRKWQEQWGLKTQVGTYTHVLHCLFPDEEIYGVKINGLGFLKTKFSLERVPARKNNTSMQVWLWNTLYWLDQIHWNIGMLENCKEDNPLMMAFPMNTESCGNYYGCLYHDFCLAWPNPLKRCDEVPPGLKVEFWSPLEKPARHEVKDGKLIK